MGSEDRFTQIPNEAVERLMKIHLSPNQWQVLLCIIRKTYGFHKKVDYIANFQIMEATNLGKTVVSRVLHKLNDMKLITRKGKYIGLREDWELWEKLAISSTSGAKLAGQLTVKKLAISSPKLAISSSELAEQSTKVSSPDVTQKKKETTTKETIQKKERFEVFWKTYPKKKSKGQAEKVFARVNPDEQLLATMLATIERAKKSLDWLKDNGRYIPHPATWLNARCWDDEFLEEGDGHGEPRARARPTKGPSDTPRRTDGGFTSEQYAASEAAYKARHNL